MTFTLMEFVGYMLAAIGGASTLTGVVMAGLWYRYVKDKVRGEIVTYNNEKDNVAAFDKAVRAEITKHQGELATVQSLKETIRAEIVAVAVEPVQVEALERTVNKIIDNQINRRDGIIHREISKQVDEGMGEVLGEVQKLREDFAALNEVPARLGRIEGSMDVILKALRVPTPGAPSRG